MRVEGEREGRKQMSSKRNRAARPAYETPPRSARSLPRFSRFVRGLALILPAAE